MKLVKPQIESVKKQVLMRVLEPTVGCDLRIYTSEEIRFGIEDRISGMFGSICVQIWGLLDEVG